jgi:hydrogenase nickel incorporation protein HypA/HybF
MHELAIVEDVIDRVSERAGGARVVRVVLEIGRLTAVLPDAVRFCFDLASEGTAAAGARLDIVETPGDELTIKEMEVA